MDRFNFGMYVINRRISQKGFTLVELLVVVVVIAILAGISTVAYNGIQDRAREATMVADLRNAANSILMYKVDHLRYPASSIEGQEVNVKLSFSPVGTNVILCADNSNVDAGFSIVAREPSGARRWFAYLYAENEVEVVVPSDASSSTTLCATTPYPGLLWGRYWVNGG